MRILSGVQSSGKLHIGNYYGALRQFVQLQDEGESFYFIANLHALTQAAGVLIDDGETVLASHGVHTDDLQWLPDSERVAVERGPDPFGNTVVAPLIVGGERIGRLAAFYGPERRLRPGPG